MLQGKAAEGAMQRLTAAESPLVVLAEGVVAQAADQGEPVGTRRSKGMAWQWEERAERRVKLIAVAMEDEVPSKSWEFQIGSSQMDDGSGGLVAGETALHLRTIIVSLAKKQKMKELPNERLQCYVVRTNPKQLYLS